MSRVLVTGAGGFIGGHLLERLAASPWELRAASRRRPAGLALDWWPVEDLSAVDWRAALQGVDAVVHLAAMAHRELSDPVKAEGLQRRLTLEPGVRLAEAAAEQGIERLVFLSSVLVHGDSSGAEAFTEESPSAPADAYARAKLAAEQELSRIAKASGISVTILRSPLVYGAGVKGNLARLLAWAMAGRPFPDPRPPAYRSMIGVRDLAEAILACLDDHRPGVHSYLLSDGEDRSPQALYRAMAAACGRRPLTVPLPAAWLRWGASILGRAELAARLTQSLQVDGRRIQRELAWRPRHRLEAELPEMVKAFRAARQT